MPAGNLVCGNRSYRIWISPPLFLCSFVLPSHSLPSRLRSRIGFHGRDHLKYHPHLSHLCPIALTPAYCLPAIAGQCPLPIKHVYHPLLPLLASSRSPPPGHFPRKPRQFFTAGIYYPPIHFPIHFFPLLPGNASPNNTPAASHIFPQAFSYTGACAFSPCCVISK